MILAFHPDEWHLLADAIRRVLETFPAVEAMETTHGKKYIVDGTIDTPSGKSPVIRTVWIIDHDGRLPRLVTAYPQRKGT